MIMKGNGVPEIISAKLMVCLVGPNPPDLCSVKKPRLTVHVYFRGSCLFTKEKILFTIIRKCIGKCFLLCIDWNFIKKINKYINQSDTTEIEWMLW